MLTTLVLGVISVFFQIITAQFPQDQFALDSGENEFDTDRLPDDNVWVELEYKVQQLLNSQQYQNIDEDYDRDYDEKSESARGIPIVKNQLKKCYESLEDQHSSTIPQHSFVYPSHVPNITCSTEPPEHTSGPHKIVWRSVTCGSGMNRCDTAYKAVQTFRKNEHNNCWKHEKEIYVAVGCKCANDLVSKY